MTQAQPNLLELAKQGNAKAIAALMNRQLQSKGLTAKATLKDGCLQVMVESAQVPDEQAMVAFMRNGMMRLGIESIMQVKVYGRQTGEDFPAWIHEFTIGTNTKTQTAPQSLQSVPPPPSSSPKVSTLSATPVVATTASEPLFQTWRCIQTLKEHSEIVYSIALSSDGKTFASGSGDKTIKIWNLNTGEVIRTLIGHTDLIYCIAISPDAKILASSGIGGKIKIWQLNRGSQIRMSSVQMGRP